MSPTIMLSGGVYEGTDMILSSTNLRKLERTNVLGTTWSTQQLDGDLSLTGIIALLWCLCLIPGSPSQEDAQTQWIRKWCYEIPVT